MLIAAPALAAPLPEAGVSAPTKVTPPKFADRCKDPLALTIRNAGFRGESIHVAWAIAMRESNGNPTVISASGDYGLFQINSGAWSNQSWWDSSAMLTPDYNARIAYKISKGGKDWKMWGLDRYGNLDATYYQSWGPDLWQAWIVAPFQKYYAQFPTKCLP